MGKKKEIDKVENIELETTEVENIELETNEVIFGITDEIIDVKEDE